MAQNPRREPAPNVTYPILQLPRWNLELQVVHDGENLWIPLAGFCKRLGISAQMQRQRLTADAEFRDEVRQMPVMTTGGIQDGWCIIETALAGWLFTIDSSRVKADIRADIRAFRKAMIVAAHELAHGATLGSASAGNVTFVPASRALAPLAAASTAPARMRATEQFALFLEAQVQDAQVDIRTLFDILRKRGLLIDDDAMDNDDSDGNP